MKKGLSSDYKDTGYLPNMCKKFSPSYAHYFIASLIGFQKTPYLFKAYPRENN